jgi:uncharacterized protein (DUF2062 family)
LDWLQVSNTRKRGVHSSRRSVSWTQLEDILWPSMGWKATFRFLLLKLRRSASDPHRVALGMGIGMWANFLPVPGLGGSLSVALAWLLRANMFSAFIGQLLGNAWTMPLIWWMCYKVGLVVFPLSENSIGFKVLMENLTLEYVFDNWRVLARSVLLPIGVGGQILGIPLAIISYWLTHWEVKRFWQARRAKREAIHGKKA